MKIYLHKHLLRFKFDAGTSRGVLKEKPTWFIELRDPNKGISGWGECALLKGLSTDDVPDYETHLKRFCERFAKGDLDVEKDLIQFPSIRFGFETALADMFNGGKKLIFNNNFYNQGKKIPINGLIWMGDKQFMLKQIAEKLEQGFTCLKMKIGAIDFQTECEILQSIRKEFSANEITLRVDANGAFTPDNAIEKLNQLADYQLHSIEQPIRTKQYEAMAQLCALSPIPVALDEELIGIQTLEDKVTLLHSLKPHYIILKPSLLGGFMATIEWMNAAKTLGCDWWITSALESNIGLNAIAQFTSNFNNPLPHGLGTGQLYTNNITSPLTVEKGYIYYQKEIPWQIQASLLEFLQ